MTFTFFKIIPLRIQFCFHFYNSLSILFVWMPYFLKFQKKKKTVKYDKILLFKTFFL